jgi:uncharacterized protein (TIGR03086 family)
MPTDDLARLVALDRRAVMATLAAVSVEVDLSRATPCVGWDVGDLVAHMTAQQHGFAQAAAGERTTPAQWQPSHAETSGDAVDAYVDSCAEVLAAFASVRDGAAPVLLPEVRDDPLPAHVAIGFHLVDNVVHAWDLAVAMGRPVAVDPDVLAAARVVARLVPDGEQRDRPAAAFAPARPVPTTSSVYDEILLLLGRDPAWSAAGPVSAGR